MACPCLSGKDLNDRQNVAEAMHRSINIDKQLAADALRAKTERMHRIIILGPASSGKTTFLKLMTMEYTSGYSGDERNAFKAVIYANIFESLAIVLEKHKDAWVALGDPAIVEDMETRRLAITEFIESNTRDRKLKIEHVPIPIIESSMVIKREGTILRLMNECKLMHVDDCFEYFFQSLEAVFRSDWVPSDQDILCARRATSRITEYKYTINGDIYQFIDVCGQKSQRMKWLQCFQNVSAIIFLAPIGSYDQTLKEDKDINCLSDALALFDFISLILFLNKVDLFDKKVKIIPLQSCLADYTGTDDIKECRKFVYKKFMRLRGEKRNPDSIYTHFTNATDRRNMKHVMTAVTDRIYVTNMKSFGYM